MSAAILLSALLFVVFAPIFPVAATEQIPAGMVYCPLSKKFQPISPPAEKNPPFSDICAKQETKDFLVQEIFIKNFSKRISLEKSALDELAFDFLAHGKAAFAKLPNLPELPPENLSKQVRSNASFNNYEFKFLWKQVAKVFTSELAPRPPTDQEKSLLALNSVYQSDELSRRLAPRAPPFLS